MDQAYYSRIENDKTDPSFSTVEKIAKFPGVSFSELLEADEIFKDVNSADKTLMEKIRLVDRLKKNKKMLSLQYSMP